MTSSGKRAYKLPVMRELMRTNDAVLLSFVEAILNAAGIDYAVLDQHTSLNLGGGVDLFQRRIMVSQADFPAAARALSDMELGHHVRER